MECIAELAHYHGKSVPEMTGEIMKVKFKYFTSIPRVIAVSAYKF